MTRSDASFDLSSADNRTLLGDLARSVSRWASRYSATGLESDVLQQTVLAMITGGSWSRPLPERRAIAFAIARRRLVDLVRAGRARSRPVKARRRSPVGEPETPERGSESLERAARLRAAIRELTGDPRWASGVEILLEHIVHGRSHGQIARSHGWSEAAVRKRYSRVLVELHTRLAGIL